MKPREEHLGIEDTKVKARPVHYGWLLMAPPGWTPIAGSAMGSRRWQRRFFVLYELGTLNWSLDDEAGTDPAGVLDLNKPYVVAKADEETQLSNTICISSLNENQNEKTIIRAETREECIFWYRSLAKMIDDSKERQKQSARRNKMLALRRRHHTVSSTTGQNTAIEEAKKINMSRDKRHQTIDNSQSATYNRRERPQSLVTTSNSIPGTSAPSTPTACEPKTITSPVEKISSENTKPPTSENSTSPADRSTDQNRSNDFVRPGRSNAVRRNQSTKVESTRVNTIPPRSSSVDRRIGYGRDRLNSYEQMMNGKNASIKQAWVSVVDAQNIKDAKREVGKKLWFSLSPGKLTAYSGPSTQESEFCVRLCPKTNIKELDHDLSSRYYQLLITLPLPVGGDVGSEKSITIGLLTEKIRKVWMDSIQQAIEQAGSRSSSISSNSEPTDITNKLERIPQHKNDSIPASINSTSISPPCENIEPESLVPNYTSTTAESNARTDPSHRSGGDAPVCIPKTRRRKRIERPKTIDLGSISDRESLLLSLQQSSTDGVKSSSPVNEVQKSTAIGSPTQNSSKKEKEENIWDRITHIEPTPIATVTAEPTRTSRPDSKSRLSDSSSTENRPEEKNRLGDELEKMREELERVKKENQEKDHLLRQANAYCTIESNCESGNNWKLKNNFDEINNEIKTNLIRLENLAKTTSQDDKNRSDSCETEIFSTPPSSPQPPINSEKKSTQTNYSSKSSTSESDENELLAARLQREEKFRQELEAELQRQKAESSKAADLASTQKIEIERQNAEIQKLKERLTLSQSNHETDKRRLEDETRVADRLKETNAQLSQDLEAERNRFNEVRSDLQVAIDSISARGPYINMDMPLNDLETRILHNIRLNT
jgi:hypothetical protein